MSAAAVSLRTSAQELVQSVAAFRIRKGTFKARLQDEDAQIRKGWIRNPTYCPVRGKHLFCLRAGSDVLQELLFSAPSS